jgi:hypothetical protein
MDILVALRQERAKAAPYRPVENALDGRDSLVGITRNE